MDVRALRKEARLTQMELAVKSGVSRVRLSLAECHYIELRPEEYKALRDAVAADIQNRAENVREALLAQAISS